MRRKVTRRFSEVAAGGLAIALSVSPALAAPISWTTWSAAASRHGLAADMPPHLGIGLATAGEVRGFNATPNWPLTGTFPAVVLDLPSTGAPGTDSILLSNTCPNQTPCDFESGPVPLHATVTAPIATDPAFNAPPAFTVGAAVMAVPEPATLLLLGAGLSAFAIRRRYARQGGRRGRDVPRG